MATYCGGRLMGCGPGGTVNTWLHELGLDEVVAFNALDAKGCDRIDLPGGSFRIGKEPHRLEAYLCKTFPADRAALKKLFAILWRIEAEIGHGIDLGRM